LAGSTFLWNVRIVAQYYLVMKLQNRIIGNHVSLWQIILTSLMVCHIYSNNWYFTLYQEADLIRQGADQTKNDAGEVRDEAEALEGRVAVTANKIKELETLAAQDEGLTTVVSACALAPCSVEDRYWSDKMHTLSHPRGWT
jgi:hypothetical protein